MLFTNTNFNMATGLDENVAKDALEREFAIWHEKHKNERMLLVEAVANEAGKVTLTLLLDSKHQLKLLCPLGYPGQQDSEHFYAETDAASNCWTHSLNEFLLDSPCKLSLCEVLDKFVSLYARGSGMKTDERRSEDETSLCSEDDDEEPMFVGLSDDDDDNSAFTTEWELKVARKKKLWSQKECEIRNELVKYKQRPGTSEVGGIQATGQERELAKQIFTNSAASGILTNDLVKIMECEEVKFTATPIDENIYQWCVKMYDFRPDSDLARDLRQIQARFGYNYIELQLDFAIDLYPFYPPLVKVIRPRLEGSMMQRVTNMEMLKLSYWNPTKDMCSVLVDIKTFLQQWARLQVDSERNDVKLYPFGSYVDIEHHLLRLALVSEVSPRANMFYYLEVERPPESKLPLTPRSCKKRADEYWAAGTGYGHNKRPEWDIKAYLAAQKLKDKQIVSVLRQILVELRKLYAEHAPQLKPRNVQQPPPQHVDPVQDVFAILEGSALVPFLEVYLTADSFLEICRHTDVYKVMIDIIKEIAMQAQLVVLLGDLPNQQTSLHQLISLLEQKAGMLLQHICKAGNGSIPKPPKRANSAGSGSSKKGKEKASKANGGGGGVAGSGGGGSNSSEDKHFDTTPVSSTAGGCGGGLLEKTAEERLAREFQILFKDVSEAFVRVGISPDASQPDTDRHTAATEAEVVQISISTDPTVTLEEKYQQILKDMQFDTDDIMLDGATCHHYASEHKKQGTLGQAQVFRIAQEVTSLATSLPINLSSSIFVRTDDEKLTLMRALIVGPEGTPYSGGCFQVDIFFPTGYPKLPPMVNLQTTGGGTVRFNPNLYNCGKVCLSLLGTWEGQQGEQWNDTTSTILQVLVSIQSLILVPEPYFNEPGYEQEIGTDAGRKHSAEYNLDVLINTIKHAMIGQIHHASPGFEDVIKAHFWLRKDRILQDVEVWLQTTKSSKLERAYQNLKQELLKLQPPPNYINLCSQSAAPRSTQI